MRKLMLWTLCLVLVFSINAFAMDEGNPTEKDLKANINATVQIGPYASVMAQKTQWVGTLFKVFYEGTPGMDFGKFTGEAQKTKFTDTNVFIVETNTGVQLDFSGTPLTHTDPEYSDSQMRTTYWAFASAGVDSLPTFVFPPSQIIPISEIGYFGDNENVPLIEDYDDLEFVNIPGDVALGLLAVLASGGNFAPTPDLVKSSQPYTISQKGIRAFQVFGFAGTGSISSQREGSYKGEIILTVSKP